MATTKQTRDKGRRREREWGMKGCAENFPKTKLKLMNQLMWFYDTQSSSITNLL